MSNSAIEILVIIGSCVSFGAVGVFAERIRQRHVSKKHLADDPKLAAAFDVLGVKDMYEAAEHLISAFRSAAASIGSGNPYTIQFGKKIFVIWEKKAYQELQARVNWPHHEDDEIIEDETKQTSAGKVTH